MDFRREEQKQRAPAEAQAKYELSQSIVEEEEQEEQEEEEEEEDTGADTDERTNESTDPESPGAADRHHKSDAIQNFIAGHVSGFDYNTIDHDENLDDFDILDREREDFFFENQEEALESSTEIHQLQGETGVQDY